MKLSPIDVQQQQFRRALRGFDSREVQAFLDLLAQQLGEHSRENTELRAELRRVQREVEEHRDRETTLKEAMLTAQRAIEEIREQAQKEAQLVVSEAELQAERLVHNAHRRVTKVLEEIGDLKRQRVRAIEELRGILSTHQRLLEAHDEAIAKETEEGTVTVLERLRAPKPPSSDDLALVDASGS